ncbi:peroxynitrite isomerase THAP4-like isoform X2 [Sander vitreus]
MVRVCAFPGCDKKMKHYNPESFHRLPLQNSDTLKQWLVVLHVDVETPVKTLREKDYRVCSNHFDKDDFMIPLRASNPPRKNHLKKSAVPRAERPVAENLDELHGTWAVMDRSPGQVRSTGIQANVPETCTATMEKPTLQHIVDEEAILQLMKNCPMCDRNCRCIKRTRSPYFIVYQSCYYCNYQRKWANQPEARNMDIRNKKLKPTNKVSVNAKVQSSQLNNTSISESSV